MKSWKHVDDIFMINRVRAPSELSLYFIVINFIQTVLGTILVFPVKVPEASQSYSYLDTERFFQKNLSMYYRVWLSVLQNSLHIFQVSHLQFSSKTCIRNSYNFLGIFVYRSKLILVKSSV